MGQEIDQDKLIAAVTEFTGVIDRIYGLYLDSTEGFKHNLGQILKAQEHALRAVEQSEPQNASVEYLDTLPYLYAMGDPNEPNTILQHQTAQGEFKRRNSPGALNYKLIGQFFIVLIYEYWENIYRARIAKALGLADKEALKRPLMGDFRRLRHDILHRNGIPEKATIRNLERMSGVPADVELYFSPEEIDLLVRALKADFDELVYTATGTDPQLRTIWHVH